MVAEVAALLLIISPLLFLLFPWLSWSAFLLLIGRVESWHLIGDVAASSSGRIGTATPGTMSSPSCKDHDSTRASAGRGLGIEGLHLTRESRSFCKGETLLPSVLQFRITAMK